MREEQFHTCYGCGLPMAHYWRAYPPPPSGLLYCVRCWFALVFRGVSPGEHERGELSPGTPTMRRRARRLGWDS